MTRNLPASNEPIVNLSGLSEECTQQEKAPDDAGAQVRLEISQISTSEHRGSAPTAVPPPPPSLAPQPKR